MTLTTLTVESFAGHLRSTFTLSTPAAKLELVLAAVEKLGAGRPGRDPFSLIFVGPAKPILPQAIYRLEHAAMGVLEIFLVPLGPRDGGLRYEAVFT